MSSSLNVTKTLTTDGWVITGTITPGGTLPVEIFSYENTGTTTLGAYAGVITPLDLARLQIWVGSIIPIFANKYVRYGIATINITDGSNPDSVITAFKASVQRLSTAYQAIATSSSVYSIT